MCNVSFSSGNANYSNAKETQKKARKNSEKKVSKHKKKMIWTY
jgi:rRNA processing protein Gar1